MSSFPVPFTASRPQGEINWSQASLLSFVDPGTGKPAQCDGIRATYSVAAGGTAVTLSAFYLTSQDYLQTGTSCPRDIKAGEVVILYNAGVNTTTGRPQDLYTRVAATPAPTATGFTVTDAAHFKITNGVCFFGSDNTPQITELFTKTNRCWLENPRVGHNLMATYLFSGGNIALPRGAWMYGGGAMSSKVVAATANPLFVYYETGGLLDIAGGRMSKFQIEARAGFKLNPYSDESANVTGNAALIAWCTAHSVDPSTAGSAFAAAFYLQNWVFDQVYFHGRYVNPVGGTGLDAGVMLDWLGRNTAFPDTNTYNPDSIPTLHEMRNGDNGFSGYFVSCSKSAGVQFRNCQVTYSACGIVLDGSSKYQIYGGPIRGCGWPLVLNGVVNSGVAEGDGGVCHGFEIQSAYRAGGTQVINSNPELSSLTIISEANEAQSSNPEYLASFTVQGRYAPGDPTTFTTGGLSVGDVPWIKLDSIAGLGLNDLMCLDPGTANQETIAIQIILPFDPATYPNVVVLGGLCAKAHANGCQVVRVKDTKLMRTFTVQGTQGAKIHHNKFAAIQMMIDPQNLDSWDHNTFISCSRETPSYAYYSSQFFPWMWWRGNSGMDAPLGPVQFETPNPLRFSAEHTAGLRPGAYIAVSPFAFPFAGASQYPKYSLRTDSGLDLLRLLLHPPSVISFSQMTRFRLRVRGVRTSAPIQGYSITFTENARSTGSYPAAVHACISEGIDDIGFVVGAGMQECYGTAFSLVGMLSSPAFSPEECFFEIDFPNQVVEVCDLEIMQVASNGAVEVIDGWGGVKLKSANPIQLSGSETDIRRLLKVQGEADLGDPPSFIQTGIYTGSGAVEPYFRTYRWTGGLIGGVPGFFIFEIRADMDGLSFYTNAASGGQTAADATPLRLVHRLNADGSNKTFGTPGGAVTTAAPHGTDTPYTYEGFTGANPAHIMQAFSGSTGIFFEEWEQFFGSFFARKASQRNADFSETAPVYYQGRFIDGNVFFGPHDPTAPPANNGEVIQVGTALGLLASQLIEAGSNVTLMYNPTSKKLTVSSTAAIAGSTPSSVSIQDPTLGNTSTFNYDSSSDPGVRLQRADGSGGTYSTTFEMASGGDTLITSFDRKVRFQVGGGTDVAWFDPAGGALNVLTFPKLFGGTANGLVADLIAAGANISLTKTSGVTTIAISPAVSGINSITFVDPTGIGTQSAVGYDGANTPYFVLQRWTGSGTSVYAYQWSIISGGHYVLTLSGGEVLRVNHATGGVEFAGDIKFSSGTSLSTTLASLQTQINNLTTALANKATKGSSTGTGGSPSHTHLQT